MTEQKNSPKYQQITAAVREFGSAVIAFSGGVDSTFLAYVAKEALGDKALAITIDSPYIPRWELEEARALANAIGIEHHIVRIDSIPMTIRTNPLNRCYLCKKALFTVILDTADAFGYSPVMDGSNFDDTQDYRPGMAALKELKVRSPLLETEWTKAEIREASRNVGLETHDKPAYACLLTRLPYNTEIKLEDLVKVEKAEVYMISLGFRAVRVRCHGNLARIEVNRDDRRKLFDEALLDQISDTIKSFGFTYVTIEAGGYIMGSLNQTIVKK